MAKLRVAVIGAGPSGLVAMKELLQEGHFATCFEAGAGIGGIFRFQPLGGRPSVWATCYLSSSAYVTSYSDFFPAEESGAPFPHRQLSHIEYLDYLKGYATRFDLWRRIRFGSEVTRVSRNDAGFWVVAVDGPDGPREIEFDAVGICSGVHTQPFIPNIPGLKDFKGQILHASDYRDGSSITGSRIVFVGAGESGAEIADEGSYNRAACYISLRRGAFVLPRMMRGYPNDYFGTRLLYSLPEFMIRRSNIESVRLRRQFNAAAFPIRIVPLVFQKLLLQLANWRNRATESTVEVRNRIMKMRSQVGATQFESFATKSDAFLKAVEEGRCELKPQIEEVGLQTVRFYDGTEVEADSIVFCTGFSPASLPYLECPVDLTMLYLRCFTSAHRESLALIGFLRPALGAIPPLSEMQARLWAQLLSGSKALPSSEDMNRTTSENKAIQCDEFGIVQDRLPHQVDFSGYLDTLAEMIGCKPTWKRLGWRIAILPRLYLTPFATVQYRLAGPHATPRLAKRLLRYAPIHGSTLRILDWLIANLLHSVGFRRFRPHLSLSTHSRPLKQE